MARQWERVDEDTAVGPRFGQDPPPSFSAPTLAYTYRQWKRDLRLWQATSSLQENRQGGWLLRQLKCESRIAAEVVMDDALVQDDGIDLIVEELDRCWEVTQDQDKASKIEKALFETQRDVKMEMTFMSNVARRKLNFQQLGNALGTPLPAVIKGYATLRAKLAESSYDKVVMWTGDSYDYDDVVRVLVRLDRPERCDPEVDAPTIVPGSEIWTQPSMDRPHWNEVLDALQEDADFCDDGETTIARDGAIAILGVFYITDDGQEAVEEHEVPQFLLQARPAFRNSGGCPRRSQRCAEVSRFILSQTRCKWQGPGTAHEALEHSTAETACELCKMSQTWTWGSRVSRMESRTTQR